MATSLPYGVFLFLLLWLHEPLLLCATTDTISADRPLSGNQTLISSGGRFALGFFRPAGGVRDKWYIALWYNKISVQTVVWIANREVPVSDPAASQLAISPDGNLVLLTNHSTAPIWSTNVTDIAANSTVATLLDAGNLVLAHASNTSSVLWQCSDHPTDTQLSGYKLSLNKVTGAATRLVSWKDSDDPSPGVFSVKIDPNDTAQFILMWNNSVPYYASGDFKDGAFGNVPEMTAMPNSMYEIQYVNNAQEAYSITTVKDSSILWRIVVDVSGQYKSYVWMEARQAWMLFFLQPKAQCTVYSACGAFGRCTESAFPQCGCLQGFTPRYPSSWRLGAYTGGCMRNAALQCARGGNGSAPGAGEDRFYVMNSVRLPDMSRRIEAASVRDCKRACLDDCSCSAYNYNGSCSIWHGDLINLQDNFAGGADGLYIRLAASELPDSKAKKLWIIGVAIGGVAAFAFLVTALYFLLRRRRTTRLNIAEGSLISFKYSDLQVITKNFSERLGGGSFGSVFKGTLPDATVVAVKKLEGLRQGEKQFRAEVSTIGTVQHINLIRLLGFCSEGAHRLLVYEYMPNSSLDRHLLGSSSHEILSWKTRYQIALGIAKGLTYLHEKCRNCIIHCDIKPENILLDASFVPKVTDFGLAKLVGRDFSRVLTTMRGTIGYLAPEWISGTPITSKADVFSYGMMLFEIISMKRNVEYASEESAETFFPIQVAKQLPQGDVQTLLDCELVVDTNSKELERACTVALWCVQDDENLRPTMGEAVQILEGLVEVNTPPAPRYLQVLAERADHVKIDSDKSSS